MAEPVRFPIKLENKEKFNNVPTVEEVECGSSSTSPSQDAAAATLPGGAGTGAGKTEYKDATTTFAKVPQFISLKPYNKTDYSAKMADVAQGYTAYLHGFYNSLSTSLYDKDGKLKGSVDAAPPPAAPQPAAPPPAEPQKSAATTAITEIIKDALFFKKDNQWGKIYVNIIPNVAVRKPFTEFTDFTEGTGANCLCPNNQQLYKTVNVRGNGNCGFYSYMLGVYYLVSTTDMTVDDDLWAAITTAGTYPTSSAKEVPNFKLGSGPKVQGELGVVFPNEAVEAFKLLVKTKLHINSTIPEYQKDPAMKVLDVKNSSDGGVLANGHIDNVIYGILFDLFNIPVFIWKQGQW